MGTDPTVESISIVSPYSAQARLGGLAVTGTACVLQAVVLLTLLLFPTLMTGQAHGPGR